MFCKRNSYRPPTGINILFISFFPNHAEWAVNFFMNKCVVIICLWGFAVLRWKVLFIILLLFLAHVVHLCFKYKVCSRGWGGVTSYLAWVVNSSLLGKDLISLFLELILVYQLQMLYIPDIQHLTGILFIYVSSVVCLSLYPCLCRAGCMSVHGACVWWLFPLICEDNLSISPRAY